MSEQPPGVLTWYKVYCVIMILLYAGVAVLGFLLPGWAPPEEELDIEITSAMFVVIGIGLAGVFLAALALPRTSWAWIVHVILICLGLTSCAFWPICIPLLIYWIKPETKAWFGAS